MQAQINEEIYPNAYIQGTEEWFKLRKTKITATDACAIMGVDPWKTRLQLYHEKLSDDPPKPPTERMQRGIDLEPIARSLYNLQTGWNMQPEVIEKGFVMASLDGRDQDSGRILEIKCPGEKDHAIALAGNIPDHYYPQLQHQMYVAGVCIMDYFSFDGIEGVIVTVKRDDEYIEKMLKAAEDFYECLVNKTPPEPCERDYIQRDDPVWQQCTLRLKSLVDMIKDLEIEEQEVRKQLVFLSGESNSKGAGISLCKVIRKGNIDYSLVPQLKGIDLEPYRKASSSSWRVTFS